MDSKLGKTVVEASTLVAISAGVGYICKKFLKTSVTNDPSNSIENYGKFTAVLVGSLYIRDYLQKEKILPA